MYVCICKAVCTELLRNIFLSILIEKEYIEKILTIIIKTVYNGEIKNNLKKYLLCFSRIIQMGFGIGNAKLYIGL